MKGGAISPYTKLTISFPLFLYIISVTDKMKY